MLNPPPLPDHAVSSSVLPAASTQSVVPPTPTTFGDEAGQSAPCFDPLSPLAVTKVTPLCPAGVVKNWSKVVSPRNSPLPQLIDTTETPGNLRARFTAFIRSLVLAEAASTTMIEAPGAITWLHSTSSASSSAQPMFVCAPAMSTWTNGLGSPYVASKA